MMMLTIAGASRAQSLHGSRSSVDRMYARAVRNDLDFIRTADGIYEAVLDSEFVMIGITMDMTLDDVTYPFVLPKTKEFVDGFAKRYHDTYVEQMRDLIDRKAKGEEITVEEEAEPRAKVLDLMAALQASVEGRDRRQGRAGPGRPRPAAAKRSPKAASSPRKSSPAKTASDCSIWMPTAGIRSNVNRIGT